jgi:hypothetical protein
MQKAGANWYRRHSQKGEHDSLDNSSRKIVFMTWKRSRKANVGATVGDNLRVVASPYLKESIIAKSQNLIDRDARFFVQASNTVLLFDPFRPEDQK